MNTGFGSFIKKTRVHLLTLNAMGAAVATYFSSSEQAAVDQLITDSKNLKSNIRSINATSVVDPFNQKRIVILIGEYHAVAVDLNIAVMDDFLKAMCGSTTRVDLFLEDLLELKATYKHSPAKEADVATLFPLARARWRARRPCANIRADPVDARGAAFIDVYKIKDLVAEKSDEGQDLDSLIHPLDDAARSVFLNAFLNTKRLCRKYLKIMPVDHPTTRVLQAYFNEYFVVPIDQTFCPDYPEFINFLDDDELEEHFAFLLEIYCVFRMMRKRPEDAENARLVFYGGDRHTRSIQQILHTCVAAIGAEPVTETIASWRQTDPETHMRVDIHETVRAKLDIKVPAWTTQEVGGDVFGK